MSNDITLSWGQCTVCIKKLEDGAEWQQFSTPVDGSTKVETEEGEKREAKVEIGLLEAVKYKKAKYTLSFDVRQAPERKDPIFDDDGIVDGEFAVLLMPEVREALYIYVPRAMARVSTSYASDEGITKTYIFDALQVESGEKLRILNVEDVLEEYPWEWQSSGEIEWASGEVINNCEDVHADRFELLKL